MDFIKPTAITDALFLGSNVPETEYDEWIGGTGVYAALSQTSANWRGMAAASDGDIYACVYGGDIYKQTAGAGDFAALSQTSRNWAGMAAAPNGDIYACVYGGDIYKQTNGTGDFAALSQTSRNWYGMAAAPNGDVYANVFSGDIYKQTNGTGDFVALSQTSRQWRGMTAAPNGDVYANVYAGDIYKQTNGTGDFVALSQTSRGWRGMTADTDGNVYACVYAGDIYKQTGGAGNFVALSQTSRIWHSMTAAPDGDIYAGIIGGDIYKSSYVPSYSQENRVVKSHVVYESLTNNNKNNDPATDTTNWLEIGPTNRWACFDGTIGNQSTQAESMTYILAPGEVDGLALLNLESTSVRVDVVDDDNTEITGTVSQAAMKISAGDGTAFVDFGLPAVLTNGVAQKAKLTLTDSAGKKLVGYIKAAGTGETWSEKVTGNNYDPDGSVGDWVVSTNGGSGNTLTYDATLDAFKVTLGSTVGIGNGGRLSTSFMGTIIPNGAIITTQAEIYLPSGHGFTSYFGVGDEGSFGDRVPYHYPPAIPRNLSLVDQWQTIRYQSYLTRADVTGYLYVYAVGGVSGGVFYFRHPSLAQLITPSATGVTITSTPDGSTYNWESQESGFNYNDANGYSYTLSLIYHKTVTTGPSKTDLVLLDLPLGHPAAEITITIENTGGTAKVGEIIVGIKTYLGAMRYSPSIGITDYSTKAVDTYGHYSVVPRTFAKRMNCSLIILNTMIDEVIRLLTLYRSTELVWVGDASYNSLIVYGFYKDFQVVFARPLSSDCALEIEGLT
jgi:hypothetical protein